ncbi:hypothetical protein M728_000398 [Ensifer sp. WSM1721]|uniref:hypothetical protein n=1 Tax=Ensifer sp. WSM1721 TaxID=1041159 RepID=UPI00047ADF68|nr:hypothetical protein [Ensifer sp. WSM1721]
MINYQMTSDATLTYRDTANAQVLTVNSASDVGNVAAIMRDSAIRVSSPVPVHVIVDVDHPRIVVSD